MSNDNASFGATVRLLREEKKIGLRKFAQMIGMSSAYLSFIERDKFSPPAEDKVRAIADALCQDADEWLAFAGRLSSDLVEIINSRPREMAILLREANGLSATNIQRLVDKARRIKLGNE